MEENATTVDQPNKKKDKKKTVGLKKSTTASSNGNVIDGGFEKDFKREKKLRKILKDALAKE
jgi:uncharacterized protein with ATP-grasp and redox domains